MVAFGWIEMTLRGRQDQDHEMALRHLAEAERLLKGTVDAPTTRVTENELPQCVARIRKDAAA